MAISLEGEEEDKVFFVGKMKTKGVEIAAGCLVGKILTTREVSIRVIFGYFSWVLTLLDLDRMYVYIDI